MPDDQSDHDKLTELIVSVSNLDQKLTEKFNDIKDAILDLKDDTSTKVADHEARIRRLELWGALGLGGAYVLAVVLKYIIKS